MVRNHNPSPLSYSRGRILGRNGDKMLRVFLIAYSQSSNEFTPSLPLSKSNLKLVCNVNNLYRNLKSKNSQDYDVQKCQQNCTFMNLDSVRFSPRILQGDGLSENTPPRAYAAGLNVEISWKGINLSTCLLNVHRFRGGEGRGVRKSQECECFPCQNISI
jgi:hypothetical protein